ncbi:MAG: EscS/YscS/HrcS family type III secretion system export apparatus protein [Bdellovibrionales bacterium RBG_16_40_8]|nr:MAG: EscS/YscS/HrcS family type III secretion system export apparatus protein [Bdellovibrionales bacterium RBG_16_40_8]
MTEEIILKLGQDAIRTTAMIASPMLLGALVIGLIISVLQAVTQINEATLTFIPKMIVICVVVLIAGPWMLDVISHYTIDLYQNIATLVRE